MLWNPSSQKLLNIEEDEAGRLKRFRKRFGRGFDVEAMSDEVQHVSGNQTSNTCEGDVCEGAITNIPGRERKVWRI